MNTAFLLILLTINSNGIPSVSFVNTQTMEQCNAKSSMIKALFKVSNIQIDSSRCVGSMLRFSKYGHNPSSNAPRNYWLVDILSQSEPLIAVADFNACQKVLNDFRKKHPSAICAVTDQMIVQK